MTAVQDWVSTFTGVTPLDDTLRTIYSCVCGDKKPIFLMGSQDIFSHICGDQIRYFKSKHVLSLTLT